MWILFLIILIVVAVFWYQSYQETMKQQTLTLQYLGMILVAVKDVEEFEKILWMTYHYNYEHLNYQDFDKKWSLICSAAQVPVPMKDASGMLSIHPSTIKAIAENIYNSPNTKRVVDLIKQKYGHYSLEQLREKEEKDKELNRRLP